MGRKKSWLSSVKKAFSPDSKKDQKSDKKTISLLVKELHPGVDTPALETRDVPASDPVSATEEVKLTDAGNGDSNCTRSPVASSELVPEIGNGVGSAHVVKEHVRVDKGVQFAGKCDEEVAAIRIQTAFRGYMARRALRALRGLVRLKSLMEGPTIKRQSSHTLRCMQNLSRVQSHICSRRIRMAEENQALQKQLLQKQAQELEKLQIGEEWDDSLQSKEQIEAKLLYKYEATMRRERALAYAFTHQKNGKNSTRSINLTFMDPSNPTWGWSWLERWMAARPWESKGMTDKELNNSNSTVKNVNGSILGGEISKAYARYQINSGKLSPAGSPKVNRTSNIQPLETPPESSTSTRKIKSASPKVRAPVPGDDSKSTLSIKSYRRHSIAGSTVRDDESMASSQAVPSYMVPTKSARAKLKAESPLGLEKNGAENGSAGVANKRLLFPSSPAKPRRHSGPPKVDINMKAENGVSHGGDS